MEWFIEAVDDDDFADRLARAISGRGAFRRFKDVLFDRPDLITRWVAFSSDRQRASPQQAGDRGLHLDEAVGAIHMMRRRRQCDVGIKQRGSRLRAGVSAPAYGQPCGTNVAARQANTCSVIASV
jgi:hypothetical protein